MVPETSCQGLLKDLEELFGSLIESRLSSIDSEAEELDKPLLLEELDHIDNVLGVSALCI